MIEIHYMVLIGLAGLFSLIGAFAAFFLCLREKQSMEEKP